MMDRADQPLSRGARQAARNMVQAAATGTREARSVRGASVWEARDRATAAAWERFAAGSDITDITGITDIAVRPQILRSWQRCRDDYKIDPSQSGAPPADDFCEHSLAGDRVVTELGSIGRSLLGDVEALGGLVAVTDGAGRVLSALGDSGALRRGEQSNLAPWSAWSEQATGTNGMGTALEDPGGVLVRRTEHWCESLRDWSCAGTTIRDPATGQPLAVLDVSSWRSPLPDTVLPWLRRAVRGIEQDLREQARRDVDGLRAAFARADRRDASPLVAMDAGGAVVAVNHKGAALAGRSGLGLAMDYAGLSEFVRHGISRARADRSWVGFAEPFIPAAGDIVPLTIRPVVAGNRVVGVLGTLGEAEGEQVSVSAQPSAAPAARAQRVLAVQGNRLIILHPEQIILAEAERNTVWLTTDHGRVRARERGLEKLVTQLRGKGFIRVHRHVAVNARRISEIRHGFRGQLSLVMDPGDRNPVPVSRRRRAAVRQSLVL